MRERSRRRIVRLPDRFPTAGSGLNARTSCAQRQAPAVLAAHSSASSRERTSTTQNPPAACSGRIAVETEIAPRTHWLGQISDGLEPSTPPYHQRSSATGGNGFALS